MVGHLSPSCRNWLSCILFSKIKKQGFKKFADGLEKKVKDKIDRDSDENSENDEKPKNKKDRLKGMKNFTKNIRRKTTQIISNN